MTYYRIRVKKRMYHVQVKAWWTLWLWKKQMAFERYDRANEYIAYRECAKYRKKK